MLSLFDLTKLITTLVMVRSGDIDQGRTLNGLFEIYLKQLEELD